MHPETARLVATAEVKAERLVGAIRMLVAAALAVVFVFEVLPALAVVSDMVRGRIIFAALSIVFYFLLGAVSYRMAGSLGYRPWMSWIFAGLDVGFILFSLGHSLQNTGLPADYLPAFVAIWLAPLFLAFGAMRYSPYLQAFVTLSLLGGIVYIAVATQIGFELPPEDVSDLFALPPNAIRLTILALTGLVLVVAAARTRALLRGAVEESRRRTNLTRYLPPQIAAWLSDASLDEIQGGQHQTVAILFADIRGFTARAHDMRASELTYFVGEFRACVTAAAEAHHGVIDKFVGDSAMVIFGIPEPKPHDARHALDCAQAILENLVTWNTRLASRGQDPVEVGIGVHSGEVFCGAVGDAARLEFTVLGDPVNVAARIEQQTKTAGYPLLVSRAVIEAAGIDPDQAPWHALPQQSLRGRAEAVDLFGAGRPERSVGALPPQEP